jgi:hypothetical protein
MIRANYLVAATIFCLGLTACAGEDAAEAVDVEKATADVQPAKNDYSSVGGKPGAPYTIDYQITGAPVVGRPVVVGLKVASHVGSLPVTLDYRIQDASSMVLAESQPTSVRMEPAANERTFNQQVTVVPQREGRFYLNVTASYETENGTMSTITAIPIQVGTGTRELEEHGEVQIDGDGDAVRVLSND